ncbi:protein ACCELERATED CELL DEATH 6-like [Corylus avellana]|uniref:protein ACCELERATED CELL DEATH 6-like n=1 Tax=Corylus avellana TaxID=13451 RepID=UPI00286A9D96|nr:protein ACCELERATED CELL DEATH 6-like [Corylus avellana]XP_059445067.1 protein ACCELERATED CELL DEATH 6-like [Corylus avellana]XP_059445068.1 protein ACCELERATED CELL DEATH 6-like [Corylus avellana]XP_059445069.1 protein ACCELERATED CELL DEATH 6-like [Corylus avellana]XP_059445070.1 protein ACCELERATED CELL DEATH 6-like [Corylus avellana]
MEVTTAITQAIAQQIADRQFAVGGMFRGDKDEDWKSLLQNAAQAHLVVAALITTVTFAACITMPGGFASSGEGSHPGSALLRKNAAFKAFVITDTISMVLSSSAVFIHLLMPFLFYKHYDERHRTQVFILASILILGAMITMVLAFVTATYAVLVPSMNLAIPICIIGLTFFVILILVYRKFIKGVMDHESRMPDVDVISDRQSH